VHADPDQQEVMVQIMKEEWGSLLLSKPLDGCDPKFHAPKLEDLRNKILIKVKKSPAKPLGPLRAGALASFFSSEDSDDESSAAPEPSPAMQSPNPTQANPKKVPICENLSSLSMYSFSQHFKNLDTRAAKKPGHIFSVSESRIHDLAFDSP